MGTRGNVENETQSPSEIWRGNFFAKRADKIEMTAVTDLTRPNKTVVRNSSLELLRITGMFMIIIFHSILHGVSRFPSGIITVNKLWYQFLLMQGAIGNNIFVLISGYFLIKSPGINFSKLFNLWIKAVFYLLAVLALSVSFGLHAFSFEGLTECFMPITKGPWWFVSIYFLMYLLHPYLNMFLCSLSRDEYKKFLLAAGLYFSIFLLITDSDVGYSQLAMFICVYSFAGYIRLWADDFGSRKYILFGIALMLVNLLSAAVLDILHPKYPAALRNSVYFFYGKHGAQLGMMRPLNILSALCMLIGFKKLDLPFSKRINFIASATLGVYMIHDNLFSTHFFWFRLFKFPLFKEKPYFVPYSVICVAGVYFYCVLVELARSDIFRRISRGRFS